MRCFRQRRREHRRTEGGVEGARRKSPEGGRRDQRPHLSDDLLEADPGKQTEKRIGGKPMFGSAEDRRARQ
jgi:hypothetical protein